MKVLCAGVALWLALAGTAAHAAARGIYTLADGDVRVLRAITWYRLAPGARIEPGDVVDVAAHAAAQLELTPGGTLNVQGPALLHAAALPQPADKPALPAEFTLLRGWCKVAATPGTRPLALQLPAVSVQVANGVVVVHGNEGLAEIYVESGGARIAASVVRGKSSPREAREGEYWRRAGDRALETEDRPTAEFVAAMPRDLRDALPALAAHFPGPPPELPAGREVTFVEAAPWLTGPTRRVFARRFASRLRDPAFRAEAAAAHTIPEWDRTLHPERYRPPASAAD
ncbi:MAG: hypothetical protein ACM3JC_17500 [Rudaea sp.]